MALNTAQAWLIVCMLAGIGLVCLFIRHVFARDKAQLIALEVKPPMSEALLRPPGHTLSEQLFELIERRDEQITSAVLSALLASLLVFPAVFVLSQVLGAPEWLSESRVRWMVGGAILALLGAIRCGYRAYAGGKELLDLKREMRHRRQGLRGEQAVAEALHSAEVAGAGYIAFHDVPKEGGGNIDHVVVGPGGIFVIETKARSQQKPLPGEKRNRLKFDGSKTDFPWGNYDFNAAHQTERNAEVMARWIRSIAPDAAIEALLVYPGWVVNLTERCEGVKAMSANQLRHYFRDLPLRLNPDGVAAVCLLLDNRCRDVWM